MTYLARVFASLVLLSAGSTALHAQPSTLLNDTFGDGDRTAQNMPSSLAWYVPGAAVNTVTVRNGALALVANDNDRLIWGYLPALTLEIGDSLTLTVDFSFNRVPPTSTGAFKIALCATNGLTPKRTDGGPPTGAYGGYASFTNPGDGTAGTRLRKRNGGAAANTTATILELTDGATDMVWATFGAARTGLAGVLQGNVPYRKMLKVTRTTVDMVRVTTSISGGTLGAANSLQETDVRDTFVTFDTIAIGAAESVQAGDLSLTRVQLVHEINTSRLTNLSVLTTIPASGEAFTLGYVVGGSGTSGSKPLVIRAVGPSLGVLGVPGTLDDPTLELFAGAAKTLENDNWGGADALSASMAQVGAFAFASAASRDAAISANIATADNSVRIAAAGTGTGAVIAELYDATPSASFRKSTPRLVNVSVLKSLGERLTVGFVVGGEGSKTVLIRAIGPTLAGAPFSVPGVVLDPRLELFSGQTRIGENDNWGGGETLVSAFGSVGAFALSAGSRDAALVVTLEPGNYSVEVSGVANTTGTALVEVYEVP